MNSRSALEPKAMEVSKAIKPVDRQEVFGKLEKILATVKLQPAAAPETETATPSRKNRDRMHPLTKHSGAEHD